jgi:hypothetical protein
MMFLVHSETLTPKKYKVSDYVKEKWDYTIPKWEIADLLKQKNPTFTFDIDYLFGRMNNSENSYSPILISNRFPLSKLDKRELGEGYARYVMGKFTNCFFKLTLLKGNSTTGFLVVGHVFYVNHGELNDKEYNIIDKQYNRNIKKEGSFKASLIFNQLYYKMLKKRTPYNFIQFFTYNKKVEKWKIGKTYRVYGFVDKIATIIAHHQVTPWCNLHVVSIKPRIKK